MAWRKQNINIQISNFYFVAMVHFFICMKCSSTVCYNFSSSHFNSNLVSIYVVKMTVSIQDPFNI